MTIHNNPTAQQMFPVQAERAKRGVCTSCGEIPGPFTDTLSVKEFGITGFCQKCQDDFYGTED